MGAARRGRDAGLAEARAQELVDATLRFADLDEVVLVGRHRSPRRADAARPALRGAAGAVHAPSSRSATAIASGLAAAAREAWQTVRAADLRYPPSVFARRARDRQARRRSLQGCAAARVLWGGVGVAAVVATVGDHRDRRRRRGRRPVVGVDSDVSAESLVKSAWSGFVSPFARSTENVCLRGGVSAGNTISTV